MFEKFYTNRCTSLVGSNGRVLSGEALEKAEKALQNAMSSRCKIWFDKNGFCFTKARALFAPSRMLLNEDGEPIKICGKRVHIAAKFCSKCGTAAPGGWWRCGNCGKRIGNDSQTCPHCGKNQMTAVRQDMADGRWQKKEEIFAEHFEYSDIKSLLGKGLIVQESQAALLLEGGSVTDVLGAGFYPVDTMETAEISENERSIVMVDKSEFFLPICVESLKTGDDFDADLHVSAVIQFDYRNASEFMRNLMGNNIYLNNNILTSAVCYDEIANLLLPELDRSVRDFCNAHTVSDLFKDPDLRIKLEDYVAQILSRELSVKGLKFIRLKDFEFESEVFERLRGLSGQVEAKRKEIEFMRRADELANDATRREAMSEFEMEDYMNQLAHEKGIKDELRLQELERMKQLWARQQEKDALSHENDLDDLQQVRQLERDYKDAEHEQEVLDLQRKKEFERLLLEQQSNLEYMQIESKIQEIKLELEKKNVSAEQDAAKGWLELKQQKAEFNQQQKIALMQASAGMDLKALLMAEDDPEKREHLLRLHEQEIQAKMTPELLLAAAAARGNAAAAAALSSLNKDQIQAIEKSKAENRELFDQMLQMSERMFNQATESMAKTSDKNNNPTIQVIK